jgi:hypothetical protein
MKIPKRDLRSLLILGGLILVLALYVTLRTGDRVRYDLPELPEFQISQVDSIEIEQGGDTVEVVRRGNDWLIKPQDYPADRNTMETIAGELASLNITELVSAEEASYPRYGVDPESAVVVRALGSDAVLREVTVGRRASTYSHTFVRVGEDTRVFHAEGDLRSGIVRGREELRDRVVMRFPRGSVEALEFESSSGSSVARKEKREASTVWLAQDGSELEAETVEQALDRLSLLRATRFSETPFSDAQVFARFVVVADERHELTLYTEQDSLYPAVSSGSDYPFFINSVIADQLLAPFQK